MLGSGIVSGWCFTQISMRVAKKTEYFYGHHGQRSFMLLISFMSVVLMQAKFESRLLRWVGRSSIWGSLLI